LYTRSQGRDLRALSSATPVVAASLSPEGIDDLARRIVEAIA
jgi:hypothetical protein